MSTYNQGVNDTLNNFKNAFDYAINSVKKNQNEIFVSDNQDLIIDYQGEIEKGLLYDSKEDKKLNGFVKTIFLFGVGIALHRMGVL